MDICKEKGCICTKCAHKGKDCFECRNCSGDITIRCESCILKLGFKSKEKY